MDNSDCAAKLCFSNTEREEKKKFFSGKLWQPKTNKTKKT
jgi:hypothetical protein